MNDVTDAFGDWLQTIKINRSATGTFTDGKYVAGSKSEVNIRAVVQNTSPDDVLVLEEGKRSTESIKLHTTTDLIALSEADSIIGDTFLYKGKTWEVANVARRFIGNYHKAVAMRIPTP